MIVLDNGYYTSPAYYSLRTVSLNRSVQIMSDVLHSSAGNDISYFSIDLSKRLFQESCFPNFLINMMSAFGLMRVETIITGVTPTFAKEYVNNFDLKNLKTKMVHLIT